MSKRKRSWKDKRKTKKQKTSGEQPISFYSTCSSLIPEIVEANPGSSAREISELVISRVKVESENLTIKHHCIQMVSSILGVLTKKGVLTRRKRDRKRETFLEEGGTGPRAHFVYYVPSSVVSLQVIEKSPIVERKTTLWDLVREFIEKHPQGVTLKKISDRVMERIREMGFKLESFTNEAEGNTDRAKIGEAVNKCLRRQIKKGGSTLTKRIRAGSSRSSRMFRYFIEREENKGNGEDYENEDDISDDDTECHESDEDGEEAKDEELSAAEEEEISLKEEEDEEEPKVDISQKEEDEKEEEEIEAIQVDVIDEEEQPDFEKADELLQKIFGIIRDGKMEEEKRKCRDFVFDKLDALEKDVDRKIKTGTSIQELC